MNALQRLDSNCRPRSVVTVDGVPNLAIHVWTNARATVSAVLSAIGMASGHRVKRSTQVRIYGQPLEGGRGPTRSMCTLSNLESGVAKVAGGAACSMSVDLRPLAL